ncbi:17625_t:CDS:2, partial [Funneliformis geosporum]
METSFNCSVLSDTINNLDNFSVNIYKQNNKIFTKLVKLWKVNVVDEDGIEKKHGKAEFTVSNIHIVTIIPVPDLQVREALHKFIRDKIETNLEAFENGSSRLNDYQGISISGGSGTGKTRHGFETINIIKDLKQIQDDRRYPRDISHVNLVVTVLQAIRQSYHKSKKLLILLQLDEYQRDEYLIANILRFTSQLVADQQICDMKILIVHICTGTAPIKLQEFDNPEHHSVTDYNVYGIHMSPMNIEKSLNIMDSVIDHKMKTSNELTNPISRNNPLYRILVGAVREIAVIMERILVYWAKRKHSIDNWLDCVGGRKDPQDITDENPITKDTALDDSTVEDHEAGGLIFLEKINSTEYKAKAPLVLM